MKTLGEVMGGLSPDLRAEVEARGQDLIQEERRFQTLRNPLEPSDGEALPIVQCPDMRLSALRDYIEAMGGTLELVAHLPGRPPVTLDGFAEAPAGGRT